MRLRSAVLPLVCALVAVPSAGGAHAADPLWVPTHPVQTGAQERLAALADGTVWAVVDHNRVLRSTDAGRTWLPVNVIPAQVNGVAVPLSGPDLGGSSDTLVAPETSTTALAANGGALSMTRDGGLTWQPVAMPAVQRGRFFEFADQLERSGGSYWLAKGGFDDVGGCPKNPTTTPVLGSRDTKNWQRTDIPWSAGRVWEMRFADARHGAALVFETKWGQPVRDGNSCSVEGSTSTSGLYVTSDAGRHWRRALGCTPLCYALSWSQPDRLVVGRADGRVDVSKDGGRSFRQLAPVPASPALGGLTALDCVRERCWALVNGGGIYRHDGSGEWSTEVSAATAPAPNIGDLAAVDRERAVAAAATSLSTRVGEGGASTRSASSLPGTQVVRIGPFGSIGADGVWRERRSLTG